jgi:hypothetical protein
MSISASAAPLTPSQKLQQSITNPNASTPTSATASVQPATAAAAQQAAQGAAQAQPKEEPFNAPMLALPPDPTTREVMSGLTKAMADPSVNDSSAQKLYSLHEQLLNADRAMIQAVIDGMLV